MERHYILYIVRDLFPLTYSLSLQAEEDSKDRALGIVLAINRSSSAEFEKASSRTGCRIFLTCNHTYATLDDDLYETRATNNQVKTLSARKADKEGHCADDIADSFFV
jgi:hypothetical protein